MEGRGRRGDVIEWVREERHVKTDLSIARGDCLTRITLEEEVVRVETSDDPPQIGQVALYSLPSASYEQCRLTSTTARALAPGSSPAKAFNASWSLVRAEVASASTVVCDDDGSRTTLQKARREVVGRG
jgi:hypothetical protein